MRFISRLPHGYDAEDVFANPRQYQELSTHGCILRFKNQSEWDCMYANLILPDNVIKSNSEIIKKQFPKLSPLFKWDGNCRSCDVRKKIRVIRKTLYDADYFLPFK